eukprot:5795816-Pyramimonas_sp.AAC.1
MAAPRPFRHTPHTFRGPVGSCTEGPSGCVGMAAPHPFRHTMAAPHPFRHTPHTFRRRGPRTAFRGPIGSSTEGP